MMKKTQATILFIIGSFFIVSSCISDKNLSESDREIRNLKAFAKVYGYLRWFHPSDEAAAINWDSLAVSGIHCLKGIKDDQTLIDSLKSIFSHIVRGLQITDKVLNNHDLKTGDGDTEVYWYHVGVGNMARYAYSQRTNRQDPYLYKSSGILLGYYSLDKTNEEFNIDLTVRGQHKDASKLLIVSAKSFPGVASQIYHIDTIKLKSGDWNNYNLSTNFQNPDIALRGLEIYAILIGTGEIEIKAPSVRYLAGDRDLIADYSFFSEPFEKGANISESSYDNGNIAEYFYEGDRLRIVGKKLKPKYDINQPPTNEFFVDEIVDGVYFAMPQVLKLSKAFQPELKKIELTNQFIRRNYRDENEYMASTLIMWNRIQHFFPYLRDLDVDWQAELNNLIAETFKIQSDLDYYFFLYEYTAKLKDGHQSAFHKSANLRVPPFYVNAFGEDVIITASSDTLNFLIGDKLLSYDTATAIDEYNYWYDITGGSTSRQTYLATERFGMRKDSSEVMITLLRGVDTIRQKFIVNSLPHQKNRAFSYSPIERVGDSILYIDASQMGDDYFEHIYEINDSRGLILDMRNGNRITDSKLINHLFDSSFSFKSIKCFLPINTDPNQMSTSFRDLDIVYDVYPNKPTIDVPICVLTSGLLLSWQETLMYSLRTVVKDIVFVGTPTAGGDGMVNTMNLPGEFRYNYTQIYFLRTDSTKHHGIGFIPDVVVEPTKEDYLSSNDRVLFTGIAELEKLIK